MVNSDAYPLNNAYLIANCGRTRTTVLLFYVVDGAYRLVARATVPTTLATPKADILVGIRQAAQKITDLIGYPLLKGDGSLLSAEGQMRGGVDYFALTTSAADPLRVILAAPRANDLALGTARRAMRSVAHRVTSIYTAADRRPLDEQIDSLEEQQPDFIFIVGDDDKKNKEPLRKILTTLNIGLRQMAPRNRPVVLYGGDEKWQEDVAELLSDEIIYHTVDSIRPEKKKERLVEAQQWLIDLKRDKKLSNIPGMSNVRRWGNCSPHPKVAALAAFARYRAMVTEGNVVAIDLGTDYLRMVYAAPDKLHTVIRSEFGMGRPLRTLLDQIPADEILRWVPYEITDEVRRDLHIYLAQKSLHPHTVPMDNRQLHLSYAVMRAMIRRTYKDVASTWGVTDKNPLQIEQMLLSGNALVDVPHYAQLLIIMMDALQPTGTFNVILDKYGLMPALGVLARKNPLAAVQVADSEAMLDLGWMVGVGGSGKTGDKAVQVAFKTAAAGTLDVEVAWDSIEVLPLPMGVTASLEVDPTRRANVGRGRGKKWSINNMKGGSTGVVVDARHRPLRIPDDNTERQEKMSRWMTEIGG